jgi:hypothetical protein
MYLDCNARCNGGDKRVAAVRGQERQVESKRY